MRSHLLAALLACALAPAARANKPIVLYLNDVKIEGTDGLRGQTFTNVDVKFDDNGDVRIVAKGYKVTTTAPATVPPAPAAAGQHRFWIATVQPRTGYAQWDIDVYINNTFIKKFRSKDADPIHEITQFLRPGTNIVHFKARKDESGDRLSQSPTDYFELVIGDGEKRAGQVMLNKISAYRRTAAETGGFDSEVQVTLADRP
jgi:hypothetical protein